jgi:hypothetical protein
MDTKIYYIPEDYGITITNNFAEIQKRMDLGIDATTEYISIEIDDIKKYEIRSLSIENIENNYFQSISDALKKYKFKTVLFQKCEIDLQKTVLDVEHLLLGEKCNIDLSNNNFKNIEEITFLETKTYSGRILTRFDSVMKLTLWHDSKKANNILLHFPNVKELNIFNGSEIQLEIIQNKHIEYLKLGNFTKLEKVVLDPQNVIKKAIIVNCKKLDTSNLPV